MKFLLSKMPGEQGKSGERKEENPGKEEKDGSFLNSGPALAAQRRGLTVPRVRVEV